MGLGSYKSVINGLCAYLVIICSFWIAFDAIVYVAFSLTLDGAISIMPT
jgi:hypothetical protein